MRRRLQFELSAQKCERTPDALRQWIGEFGAQTSSLDANQMDELAEELDAMRVTTALNLSGGGA